MSERTLNLTWCSFTCYEKYVFPENIKLVNSQMVFDKYKKQLFDERILNNDEIWREFFETYLLPLGFGLIKRLLIAGDSRNANRKFGSFAFFENTVEITFRQSKNELMNLLDFLESIGRLNEIIISDINEILGLFDLEFNYTMMVLGDKTEYEADFEKRFESKEMVFYNIFEPIRNYLTTHFEGFDIAKIDFICGELKIFKANI